MQADNLRLRHHVLEGGPAEPILRQVDLAGDRVVTEDASAERHRTSRDFQPHIAAADDADLTVADLPALPARPFAGLDARVGMGNVSEAGKHEAIASSATEVALAPAAVNTAMPRFASIAIGRLSMPVPLRLMARRSVAAAIARSETGSTPASQPTQPDQFGFVRKASARRQHDLETGRAQAVERRVRRRGRRAGGDEDAGHAGALATRAAISEMAWNCRPDVAMSNPKTSLMTCIQPWMK